MRARVWRPVAEGNDEANEKQRGSRYFKDEVHSGDRHSTCRVMEACVSVRRFKCGQLLRILARTRFRRRSPAAHRASLAASVPTEVIGGDEVPPPDIWLAREVSNLSWLSWG